MTQAKESPHCEQLLQPDAITTMDSKAFPHPIGPQSIWDDILQEFDASPLTATLVS